MQIINPIYDHSFKYLMQDNRIAKKVLSVLLGKEVKELTLEQQEIITIEISKPFKLYRLDLSALIVNEEGKEQRVLIELQKSNISTALDRFRTYLGSNYQNKGAEDAKEEKKAYPIIAIYILGYNLKHLPYLAVSVDPHIRNTITNEKINTKSDFVHLLTHQTRIIQLKRLSDKSSTRLERFLNLFNQKWILSTKKKYILEFPKGTISEEFSDIVRYLQIPVANLQFRKKLEGEAEAERILGDFEKREKMLEQQVKEVTKKAEEERLAKEAAKRNEAAAKKNEEAAKKKALALSLNFAKFLLSQNTPIATIMKETGLSRAEIEKL